MPRRGALNGWIGLAALAIGISAQSQELLTSRLGEDFGARPDMRNLHLAPSGERASFLQVLPDGTSALRVVDFGAGRVSTVASGEPGGFDLLWCDWASESRILCAVMATFEFSNEFFPISRMLALDVDGTHRVNLLPRTDVTVATRLDRVVDWMVDEPGRVLVEAVTPKFQIVDLETGYPVGGDRMLSRAIRSRALHENIYTDGTGVIRVFKEVIGRTTQRWFERTSNEEDWSLFKETTVGDPRERFFPLGFGETRRNLYYVDETDVLDRLMSVDLSGDRAETVVFEHARIEVPVRRSVGKYDRLVGVGYTDEVTRMHVFDAALRDVEQRLAAAFPDADVDVVDEDWERRYYIARVAMPRRSERFYRFDASGGVLVDIGAAFPHLEQRTLVPARRFEIPASDGSSLPVWVTVPDSIRGPASTVVLTRSEPLSRSGLREHELWSFDYLAQAIAAMGYTVVQVGYRGLGGYAVEWDEIGTFRGWRRAIDDIDTAVEALIARAVVDSDHLCIVGWGSGGFAALMSGIEVPARYRCVASIAGVSDPGDYRDHLDEFSIEQGIEGFIGQGREVTRDWAPRARADEMGPAVLMFHARNDFVIPFEQSRAMHRALVRAGKLSELVEYDAAEHSLREPRYRIDMLARLEAFFRRYL